MLIGKNFNYLWVMLKMVINDDFFCVMNVKVSKMELSVDFFFVVNVKMKIVVIDEDFCFMMMRMKMVSVVVFLLFNVNDKNFR